jgi:hypothetical protein
MYNYYEVQTYSDPTRNKDVAELRNMGTEEKEVKKLIPDGINQIYLLFLLH